jgi:hypothetical protein
MIRGLTTGGFQEEIKRAPIHAGVIFAEERKEVTNARIRDRRAGQALEQI